MGYKNREIEVKLQVMSPASFLYVNRLLRELYSEDAAKIIKGHSKDVYFKVQKKRKADFIRVRYGTKFENSQVTLKYSDKKHNKNRVEKDLEIHDPDQATSILNDVLDVAGEISKRYYVYFMSKHDNISVYQIDGDSRVFVEIEATTRKKMLKMQRAVTSGLGLELKEIKKSLFQLFLKEGKAA